MDFVNRMSPGSSVSRNSLSSQFPRIATSGVNPFEQVFEIAVDNWITEKYTIASMALKTVIQDTSGIWMELDRVHGIYCMLSHQCMMSFQDKLFQRVFISGRYVTEVDGSI